MVDERLLTVDLDDGQARAVPRLELRVAGHVDDAELETEPLGCGNEHQLRLVAQRAVRRAVQDDLDGVGHPVIVNGSARSARHRVDRRGIDDEPVVTRRERRSCCAATRDAEPVDARQQ